jgi:hypothetical protein
MKVRVLYGRRLTHSSAHLDPTVESSSDVPLLLTTRPLQVLQQLDADTLFPCLLAAGDTEEKYV